MFQNNGTTPNGLNPGDRMPGAKGSVFDEMDGLMSDWSWRPRLRDLRPVVYMYSDYECRLYELHASVGHEMLGQQPWSFPAYRGVAERPQRIGVTR